MEQRKKRVVVKVGTSTLAYPSGGINFRELESLTRVLADMMNMGLQVVLVTSGAIGVGMGKMGLRERPRDTAGKQAAATVGQCELMYLYDKMFSEYGHVVGQLLITKGDVEDPERRHNLCNTFECLFEHNVLPVINENDAVAVEEIVYGDNDNLSAIVAVLIQADMLFILTDIDGLYDDNPRKNPEAKLISRVERITPDVLRLAQESESSLGTGGMVTKLQAAQRATAAGIPTYVFSSRPAANIYEILDGKPMGTLFEAVKQNDA
ncbi:MAG TPA: glutamate 5-kinase [Candidatus Limnocylindria bacterium]|nr:glutamate 5-kinase [Candidatus Limnocylindria bacterium]